MELEVQLSRTGAEPWGFRLIGGSDFNMPLTVVKVLPDSPADLACLCNGDTVSRIQGADASAMTHDAAKAAVAAAEDSLNLGVTRGLYDPVLDDFDPIYEPLDQEDFDQPSLPTEVFQIKQFSETPVPDDLSRSRTGSRGDLSLGELRSTTQSPFLIPTKPYRPFSTEPTPVPPLEEPIILNPDYHDEFGKVDDVLGFSDGLDGVLSEKTRFKLPISEQYDPDGSRLNNKEVKTDVTKDGDKLTKEVVTSGVNTTSVEEILSKEERVSKEVKETLIEERLVKEQQDIKFMEKIKTEIDLDKIEKTATSIVDESIEKAVTVAAEIKKEIDLELSAITSETKTSLTEESKSVIKTDKNECIKEVNELISMIDKTTDVIIKVSDVSVAKEVAKFETDNKQIVVDECKASIKQELQETIESGSVRRKSELYSNEIKTADVKVQKSSQDETKVERKQSKITSDQHETKQVRSSNEDHKSEITTETTSESVQKSEESKSKEAKYTTAKLLAEQRAYTIGLQTIPHIRGTVQSSYHYDLLLKTFFIHLTDVMVALSRFILAEPVLSKPLETKPEVKKDVKEVVKVQQDEVTTKSSKTVVADSVVNERKRVDVENKQSHHEQQVDKITDKVKQEVKKEERIKVESNQLDDEETEKIMLSGAEMSQLSEKRSEELISKMGGVISEFQTKAGLEEEIVMQRERRSRSRSKISEDVMKEADPLEWLSKVETNNQETTEIKTRSSVLESTEMKTEIKSESTETKRESKQETRDLESTGSKNMYIAIVESHVYTNKNSIMDEVAEVLETTSVESIEKTNIALEANEAMKTERVAIESQSKQEKAEVVESHEMISAKTEDVFVQEKKHIVQKENIRESIEYESKKVIEEEIQKQDIQESVVEVDTKKMAEFQVVETIEPIIELHEDIVEKAARVEIKNKMDIQEIQTSEYIDDLSVLKEESVEIMQSQNVQELKEVQDVRISEEVKKVDILDELSSKIEDVSLLKEEVKQVQDIVAVKEESIAVQDVKLKEVVEDIKVAEEMTVVKKSTEMSDKSLEAKNEFAHLKVVKEELTEIDENIEFNQEIEVNIKKSVHIEESENKYQSYISESSIENSEYVQESSFIARSTEEAKKQLTLDLNTRHIKKSDSETSIKSTISTPTPSTVPPTPLTDEYVFSLQIPLPKITGPPIPRSPSPEDEDPHIVKKNLVPHIDTEIIEEIVYDTPLPTPPEDKTSPPRFTKPGLKGGNVKYMFYREEIKEIERKSSLLASAIDQTIKSIEEYKEEVGIDTKLDNPVVYNGYAKVIETKVFKDKLDEVNIEKQIIKNTENIKNLVESRESSADSVKTLNVNGKTATVRVTVENNVDNKMTEASDSNMDDAVTVDVEGYRPVPFNPEDAPHLERVEIRIPGPTPTIDPGKAFVSENGEIIGTHQGIVDGLEEPVVDEEVAKELGKPGMTEEKIAELISGESEMLREAHVMGLTRVLRSHMHRDDDDSSVDFKKIKPIVESLKDSEVLKALNEEFMRTQEEKKKEERKWTKFLQKPERPVPKAKFGYHGWTGQEEEVPSPYKVKIVKQPKPKVAPDYKPQDFNTGPLPWEERARNEPPPPPVEPEEPILVPEEGPVFLEAVDPLPESEVPDLEETGIPLPPEKPIEESKPEPEPEPEQEQPEEKEEEVKEPEEPVVEENSDKDMENRIAEQLMKNVEGMVDPNAPLEQQLQQMRAQLAALAQLPGVIQQTLELVTRQLCQITQQEAQSHQPASEERMALRSASVDESNENSETVIEDVTEEAKEETQIEEVTENGVETNEEVKEVSNVNKEEMEKMKREEQEILEEQRRVEKQKKEMMADLFGQEPEEQERPRTPHEIAVRFINELMDELQLEQESRQVKQRPTPRVGNPKPKPAFGPLTPAERPLVLPGGRKWRKPKDAYNDQFIAETLTAQAELIQGKAMGKTYESVHLPYDERVNFMKYEKPPVTLDHLQHSDVYKLIHNMEQEPARRVDMLTPVIAEADYREKCRSMTPCAARMA